MDIEGTGPADRVAKALTAPSRLAKTTHILRYIHEETLRRKVQLQLNRDEFCHILAKWLFFANQGAFAPAIVEAYSRRWSIEPLSGILK